jgi:hypothetical protein
MVCLQPSEAERAIENKIEIYNWMQQTNALLCYYEVRESKTVCAYSGAASRQ